MTVTTDDIQKTIEMLMLEKYKSQKPKLYLWPHQARLMKKYYPSAMSRVVIMPSQINGG